MDGILLVDKPAGMTSAGVVREVKRRLGGVKVGHLGTLDPFATGLLPLCIGEGAKLVPFLNEGDKVYSGAILLGRETDTLDATGETVAEAAIPPIDRRSLADVARRFLGEIDQVPPMFSAIKREGVPLYRLARKGVEVERQARRVTIHSLDLEPAECGLIELRVHCSKGTYVRCLARDIALALGSVGHLARLRREAFGNFRIAEAVALESVAPSSPAGLIAPRDALRGRRELTVTLELAGRVRLGQQWALATLPGPEPGEIAMIILAENGLVAIVGEAAGRWKSLRVWGAPASPADSSATDP